MSTPVGDPKYSALRDYNRCLEAMLADPDVHGDLFLVGLYLARRRFLLKVGQVGVADMCAAVFGPDRNWRYRFERTMRQDIRRYDPYADPDNAPRAGGGRETCGAPMVRRPGPCGQHGTQSFLLADLDTGRRRWVSSCARHHSWLRNEQVINRANVKALGAHLPVPPANAGGALARHLTFVDWHAYWGKLQPGWVPPPEETPVMKPRLTLIITDDVDTASPSTGRPQLAVVTP